MTAAPAWAGLRNDLVHRILDHLPCLAYRAAFTAVCFNWHAIERAHALPGQLPWLLLPSATEQEPCFFCLRCKATHRVSLPDDVRRARCCGSCPGGWLVLELEPLRRYALHNLHNGNRVLLPEIPMPDPIGDHGLIIHAAKTSQEGASAAVAWSASTIAFWRPQMQHWSPPTAPEEPRGRISDVIYFLDGFHVITDEDELLVYVTKPEGGALTTRLETYRCPGYQPDAALTRLLEAGCTVTRYLVDYFDKLLRVARVVSPYGNKLLFSVLELVPALAPAVQPEDHDGSRLAFWVQMHVIPTGMLVLGRCSSRAYGTWGIDYDGVYFLDDETSFHDAATRALKPAATRWYPCSDMGWLPLLSRRIEQVFPARRPSEHSRAVWFFL